MGDAAPHRPRRKRLGQGWWLMSRVLALVGNLALAPLLVAGPFICGFVDSKGRPLKNVETRLTAIQTDSLEPLPPLYRKSTDEGTVEYPELLNGQYVLEVQLRGYVPFRKVVTAGVDSGLSRTLLKTNEFERVEKQAHRALDEGEYLEAIDGLSRLASHYPEDAVLHDGLARAYAGLLDGQKALEEARLAASLDPEVFSDAERRIRKMILRNEGEQALQSFNLKVAEAAFEALRDLEPTDSAAYEGLALAYGHQGKLEQAVSSIRKAIELDPDNPRLVQIQRVLEDQTAGN